MTMKTSDKKVTVKLTYEWEITEKEYNESKDFFQGKTFDWKSDPVSLFHFLNDTGWPTLSRKTVERIA